MRVGGELTARKVATLTAPGRYADGLGLYLQVSQFGTKAWLLRFMLDGRARAMGLGPLHTVSLQEARERAREARQLLLDGVDPIAAKREKRSQQRVKAANRVTFRECAEKFMATHSEGWRNAEHRRQWQSGLVAYVYPTLGNIAVADIDLPLILKVLEPAWRDKRETMSRIRGRIEGVLDWASARGFRDGDNPAAWKKLKHLLPAKRREKTHLAALPWREVPTFIATLRKRDGIAPRALEFLILTAARTDEVLSSIWNEIDIQAKTWAIPAGRMKAAREHRVALSDRAVEILLSLPRENGNPFVFIGARARQASDKVLLRVMRAEGIDATVHGFRASFRTWAAERTSFPREIAEAALAHQIPDAVERSYLRGSFWDKRVRLMEEWARFCCAPPAPVSEVVPIGARRS